MVGLKALFVKCSSLFFFLIFFMFILIGDRGEYGFKQNDLIFSYVFLGNEFLLEIKSKRGSGVSQT